MKYAHQVQTHECDSVRGRMVGMHSEMEEVGFLAREKEVHCLHPGNKNTYLREGEFGPQVQAKREECYEVLCGLSKSRLASKP